jgi:SNF2 family DNA or RNA helicase
VIEIDWKRCRFEPFAHQKIGTRELVGLTNNATGRVMPGVFALGDQVGAGKTKQLIDAAQFVYLAGDIDTVVCVTPGFARSVWANPDPVLGEIAKHAFTSVDSVVHEHFGGRKATETITFRPSGLHWIVTNYEFMRREERLKYLLKSLRGRKVWLVLDESWAIKTHNTDNAKACRRLRQIAQRATILNGSLHEDPLDLYSQMNFLDPRILAKRINGELVPETWTSFRARYAIMGGYKVQTRIGKLPTQVIGYQNLDELMSKVKPYILQRKTRECIDLPPELPPVWIEAKLTDETWKIYKQMCDDMVAWLDDTTMCSARQAVVKGIRLAQITSGFLGGIESCTFDPFDESATSSTTTTSETREIGREKLDALMSWLRDCGDQPDRLLVWCRFKKELDRTAKTLAADYDVYRLEGGQTADDREAAKRVLAPGTTIDGPVAVVGNTAAGGAGLNLSGANVAVYLSLDYSLLKLNQSKGRIDRPGQTRPITYVYVNATGPNGQKTIDHHVFKALVNQEQISEWTTAQWRTKLLDE